MVDVAEEAEEEARNMMLLQRCFDECFIDFPKRNDNEPFHGQGGGGITIEISTLGFIGDISSFRKVSKFTKIEKDILTLPRPRGGGVKLPPRENVFCTEWC